MRSQELNIDILCEEIEEICEGRCFNPDSYNCFPYLGLGKVCPKGQYGCGGECFASDSGYNCLTTKNGEEILCKEDQTMCGSTCFTPDANDLKCIVKDDFETLCKKEEELCGTNCYDPTTQVCFNISDNNVWLSLISLAIFTSAYINWSIW